MKAYYIDYNAAVDVRERARLSGAIIFELRLKVPRLVSILFRE